MGGISLLIFMDSFVKCCFRWLADSKTRKLPVRGFESTLQECLSLSEGCQDSVPHQFPLTVQLLVRKGPGLGTWVAEICEL